MKLAARFAKSAGARSCTGYSRLTGGGRTVLLRLRWSRPDSDGSQAIFGRPLSQS